MSKPDDKPPLPEARDLAASKREFIETFFKRGAEFTEELMRENERLRFRVVQLEEERRALAGATTNARLGAGRAARAGGAHRVAGERAEQLLEPLSRRVERAERHDFSRAIHEIERENNNLANLYVASYQLHSTLDLREVTQIILEILLNFVGAKTFAIQLVDDERRRCARWPPRAIDRAKVPERRSTTGRVGQVVASGQPYLRRGAPARRAADARPSRVDRGAAAHPRAGRRGRS